MMGLQPQKKQQQRLLRSRSNSPTKKPLFSCVKIIAFLMLLQFAGVFMVAFRVGNSIGGVGAQGAGAVGDTAQNGVEKQVNIDENVDADDANSRPARIPDPERVKEWDELEQEDPREHRILYSDPNNKDTLEQQQQQRRQEQDQEQEDSTIPLDNYGSRPHFEKPAETIPNGPDATDRPYLIVGGSDGSGTRATVNTLIELGAFFHVEDKVTMDIHGQQMFQKKGWPALVNLLMNHTRSANYEVTDLPPAVRKSAIEELTKMKSNIDLKSKNRMKHQNFDNKAAGIHIGFKAPVTMLLLPVLREVFGSVKFLHVIRDGRDVSFSENKSPVTKFYNTYYGLHESENKYQPGHHKQDHGRDRDDKKAALGEYIGRVRRAEKAEISDPANTPVTPPVAAATVDDKNVTIQAMELWNDWNYQVNEYGKSHADGTTFDYLVVRSEDLVNPDTKLAALMQLADFVGSRHSLKSLCCQSKRVVQDLGKSNGGLGASPRRGPLGLGGGRLGGRHGHGRGGDQGRPMRMGVEDDHSMADKEAIMNAILNGGMAPDSQYSSDSGDLDPKRNGQNQRQAKIDMIMAQHNRAKQHRQILLGEDLARKKEHPPPLSLQKQPRQLPSVLKDGLEVPSGDSHISRRLGTNWEEARRRGAFGKGKHPKKEAPEKVMARYGKWVKRLEKEPELSQKLHELGGPALKAFGYEPPVPFLDRPDETFRLQCEDMLQDIVCPAAPAAAQKKHRQKQ